jgi:hypothetical protein
MNLNQEKIKQILEKATALISEIKNSDLELDTKLGVLKLISNKALATANRDFLKEIKND